MKGVNESTDGGKSPLLVEGMAPLDVLVNRLDMTIEQFCKSIGINDSTYRRWRTKGIAHLTHLQAKRLDALLRTIGLSIQDLPDSLAKHIPIQSA